MPTISYVMMVVISLAARQHRDYRARLMWATCVTVTHVETPGLPELGLRGGESRSRLPAADSTGSRSSCIHPRLSAIPALATMSVPAQRPKSPILVVEDDAE